MANLLEAMCLIEEIILVTIIPKNHEAIIQTLQEIGDNLGVPVDEAIEAVREEQAAARKRGDCFSVGQYLVTDEPIALTRLDDGENVSAPKGSPMVVLGFVQDDLRVAMPYRHIFGGDDNDWCDDLTVNRDLPALRAALPEEATLFATFAEFLNT